MLYSTNMPIFQQKSFGTVGSTRNFGKKIARASATMVALTVVGVATAMPSQAQTQTTLLQYPLSIATQYSPTVQDSSIGSATFDISRISVTGAAIFKNDGETNDGNIGSYNAHPFSGATSDAAALTGSPSYYAITITAATNTVLNFSSVSFDAAPGGNSGPRGADVRAGSNVAGYGDPALVPLNQVAAVEFPATATGTDRAFTTITSDLSGNANLQRVTSVQFRFYVYSPSANSTVDFRNLLFIGSSDAVPEPSAFALVLPGVALLGTAVARRRRLG